MPQIHFQIDFLYYGSSERAVVLVYNVKLLSFPRCDAPSAPPWQATGPETQRTPVYFALCSSPQLRAMHQLLDLVLLHVGAKRLSELRQ
jgi:hypothetical protein